MDFEAGISFAAMTVASTEAFVKYQSGNLGDTMKSLREDIKGDMQKLDHNMRRLDNKISEDL